MTINRIIQPFKENSELEDFLSSFILVPDNLPISDQDLHELDKNLLNYERAFLNPDIEQNLISKNELFASFAISKAENSNLTLDEAKDVYRLVLSQPDLDFIANKLEKKEKLNKKDYEKLEFFNIVKTFRYLTNLKITIDEVDANFILDIHSRLTNGLDIFANYLPKFDIYKSGNWRNNNNIRVGDYKPSLSKDVLMLVENLLTWIKKDLQPSRMGIFHTALYAVHPFSNGNKRVCRLLEHFLWRLAGFNKQNLYSLSYYYHQQKDRYYKYLLSSITKRHLNYFTAFTMESASLSILGVLKTSIESLREANISQNGLGDKEKQILKWLIKRKEMNFKSLLGKLKNKMAKQTLVTYLKKLTSENLIKRRKDGKRVLYSLNLDLAEEELYLEWISIINKKLKFIPSEYRLVI